MGVVKLYSERTLWKSVAVWKTRDSNVYHTIEVSNATSVAIMEVCPEAKQLSQARSEKERDQEGGAWRGSLRISD